MSENDAVLYLSQQVMESIARATGEPIYKLFPRWYADRLIPLNDAADAKELAHRLGGRAVKPDRDIVLVGPDGKTPILLVVDPGMEAAEAEDIALEHFERVQARGYVINFAAHRAKKGRYPKEQFDQKFREALEERMERHRRNPITDPAKRFGKTRGYVRGASFA